MNILEKLKNIYRPNIAKVSSAFAVMSLIFFLMLFTETRGITGLGYGFPAAMMLDPPAELAGTIGFQINEWLNLAANTLFWYILASPVVEKVNQ